MDLERRYAHELRVQGRKLQGYAAKFGIEAMIGTFREKIRAGAFKQAIASNDVLALSDHNPEKILARTKSGTLRLAEDTIGLRFEIDVPDTQVGRDVLTLCERGDLGGCSFGFHIHKDGDVWEANTRTLVNVDLKEISLVSAWPAYPLTEVVARSRPAVSWRWRYLDTL